ncbi:uncharacterized protein LOC111373709 [Olea europaea var. sylvestris]|uniref:uncharacterized protein LOC111373709 n=1 Tax=Olea europaea var. sylvestris TaxID=158386 RepID=UPI000C1D2119|nr:uncharacterized protein LOC111373709 [Olea europaea var. sylvestris]
MAPITFSQEDTQGVHHPHCDVLVVRVVVARNRLKRMLVNNGSSVNILFGSTFDKMQFEYGLIPMTDPLFGFTGDNIIPQGRITLLVEMGSAPLVAQHFMEFLVVDHRELDLDVEMHDAPEIGHTSEQEEDVDMEEAFEEGHPLEELDPQITGSEQNTTPMEELETFSANPENSSQHEDMVGIDPRISCHRLNINASYAPCQQKRRALNPEGYEVLKEEVNKLSRSGFIREAIYPKWISNSVLVRKPSEKWKDTTRYPCFDLMRRPRHSSQTEDYTATKSCPSD